MSQLASDPALTQTSVQATDLLVFLRPVTDDQGTVTGFQPCNIKASDFALSITAMGLLAIAPTLPATAPENGGLFLNADAISYSPVTGTESGAILTQAAMQKSYAAWVASLPTSDPGTGPGTFWNNNGVATESVLSP
ncbi:hypothetical protein JK202_10870 [Gluconobacter sp. Dm-62]|uniref:hypothetical protein n=1 Tax=Gluconobacter sp. Dm-62 TaxID=2799804 RepID=UPI001B8C5130|nr:hypothetical protein [Gluconobacter sp. Dm-62]MBS1103511.1 hypothetical protein [Gluconobacter sp. Dm-62]